MTSTTNLRERALCVKSMTSNTKCVYYSPTQIADTAFESVVLLCLEIWSYFRTSYRMLIDIVLNQEIMVPFTNRPGGHVHYFT